MIFALIRFTRSQWLAITVALLAVICVLSLIPLPQLPQAPGSDKTHHLIAYAALMFPAALRRPKHWILLGLLLIACSWGIEMLQPLVNRHMEWKDLLANSAGILCGALLGRFVDRFAAEEKQG